MPSYLKLQLVNLKNYIFFRDNAEWIAIVMMITIPPTIVSVVGCSFVVVCSSVVGCSFVVVCSFVVGNYYIVRIPPTHPPRIVHYVAVGRVW